MGIYYKQCFRYDVQVWTTFDGIIYAYCGNGRFCRTLEDVAKTVKHWYDIDNRFRFKTRILTEFD